MQGTTSVRINNKLHRALRAKAKLEGRTVIYLLNEAVEKSLAPKEPAPGGTRE